MPETAEAEARTVEVVWSTGAAVRRRDPWTGKRYDEVLSLDPAHVDLSRLNNGAPLLNTHGAFDLEDVIGVVERAWIARQRGRVRGPRRRPLLGARRRRAALAGRPHRHHPQRLGRLRRPRLRVIDEDGAVPVWRAVDWQPLELSAVPVGADGGAGFRQRQGVFPCRLIHRARRRPSAGERDMDQQIDTAVEHPAEDRSAEATTGTP